MLPDEKALVGCCLLEPTKVLPLCAEAGITPEYLSDKSLSTIFSTIIALSDTEPYVDFAIVETALQRANKLDAVGGHKTLEDIIDSTPTATRASSYIDKVRERHQTNELRKELHSILDGQASGDELLASIESVAANRRMATGKDIEWTEANLTAVNRARDIRDGKIRGGLSTGIHSLDNLIYGLRDRELIIIGARPANGKTSLAMNIAEHVARKYGDVAIASCEMHADDLAQRMINAKAGVTTKEVELGWVTDETLDRMEKASAEVRDLPLHVWDCSGKEVSYVRAKARRLSSRVPLRVLVVDYLQLLNCSDKGKHGRVAEVTAISNQLKSLAMELEIPVIVLSQLNRSTENRSNPRPRLSDLRESGSIEQDIRVNVLYKLGEFRETPAVVNPEPSNAGMR